VLFRGFGMLQVHENEISLLAHSQRTLLTMQCKWTFAKRFILSTLQRKCPMLR